MTQYAKLDENGNLIQPTEFNGGYYPSTSELIHPEEWMELVTTDKPQETSIVKYSEVYYVDTMNNPPRIIQRWNQYILEPIGRVAKLSGNQLVFPPQNLSLEDGTLLCNFDKLPNSRKLGFGFYLVIEAERPNDGKQYRETGVLVDDADFGNKIQIVLEEVAPLPEQPFAISKILLKQAMVAIGKWDDFRAVLMADADAYEDFMFAVVLMSNDPRVLQFKAVCVQMFGFTEQQVDDMLKQCKSDL